MALRRWYWFANTSSPIIRDGEMYGTVGGFDGRASIGPERISANNTAKAIGMNAGTCAIQDDADGDSQESTQHPQ